MKKPFFFASAIAATLVFLCFSCAGAPEALDQHPAPAIQQENPAPSPSAGLSQAVSNELNAAITRAEEAKKRANDFEGASYFPGEWESAEERYANANSMPRSTDAEAQNAISAYKSVADAFDSIFNLTIPLYAQAQEDEIVALWEELVAMGARATFLEYFVPADEMALLAHDQYGAADYYTARDTGALALLMYKALKASYEAFLARQEIVENNFMSYEPDSFDLGEEAIEIAFESYKEGNIPLALEKAEEALQAYNYVLDASWFAYARIRSALAAVERQLALDIKANIATRDLFSEGDTNFNSGLTSLDAQNYREAALRFVRAETQFILANNFTEEKRRIAEEAIVEAHQKIQESDETARQAELIMEGGAK